MLSGGDPPAQALVLSGFAGGGWEGYFLSCARSQVPRLYTHCLTGLVWMPPRLFHHLGVEHFHRLGGNSESASVPVEGCPFPLLLSGSRTSCLARSCTLVHCCSGRRGDPLPSFHCLPGGVSSTPTFRCMAVWISQTSVMLHECLSWFMNVLFMYVSGVRLREELILP